MSWKRIGPVLAAGHLLWIAVLLASARLDYVAASVLLALVMAYALFEYACSRAPQILQVGAVTATTPPTDGTPPLPPAVTDSEATKFGLIVGMLYAMFGVGGVGVLSTAFGRIVGDSWFTGLSLMMLWLAGVAVVTFSVLRDRTDKVKPAAPKPDKKADPTPAVSNAYALTVCGTGRGGDGAAGAGAGEASTPVGYNVPGPRHAKPADPPGPPPS